MGVFLHFSFHFFFTQEFFTLGWNSKCWSTRRAAALLRLYNWRLCSTLMSQRFLTLNIIILKVGLKVENFGKGCVRKCCTFFGVRFVFFQWVFFWKFSWNFCHFNFFLLPSKMKISKEKKKKNCRSTHHFNLLFLADHSRLKWRSKQDCWLRDRWIFRLLCAYIVVYDKISFWRTATQRRIEGSFLFIDARESSMRVVVWYL